ncbi:Transcription factor [Cytospora paraplurivora]|uniref:Transcription factor n=1 Tax=Cytospora paraplurivora TaxID=2898453 RepID=A0AAN9YCW9_9PEZI
MDKKKKSGPNGNEDQDRSSENDSRSKPAQRGSVNGDAPRGRTSTSSDKDGSKAQTLVPDDANSKHGPQKKRRKVTHGTALIYPDPTVVVPLHGTQSPRSSYANSCANAFLQHAYIAGDLCIKRNIGHLCHDEPREHDSKKVRGSTVAGSTMDESDTHSDIARSTIDHTPNLASVSSMRPTSFEGGGAGAGITAGGPAGSMGRGSSVQLVRPTHVSGLQAGGSGNHNMNQFHGFSDAWLTAQNQLQDMQNNQNNYLMVPEVSNEFNLLNEFLNSSLLDDAGLLSGDSSHALKNDNDMLPNYLGHNSLLPPSALPGGGSMQPPESLPPARPAATVSPEDKKHREAAEFFLQVADPSGNDTPEARMERVLRAKYDAGVLKPFNYIQGYKRLQDYLESHIAPTSKQKILAQINRFRPTFREKMQRLTDIQLIYVEMWFEKTLMEYDRVFASMAVPACLWRRTGEIFRGNKEMAELIGVQVEDLRDGRISLHQILTEASMVRYWEEFGTIAFDPAHDTLLTACQLKCPIDDGRSRKTTNEKNERSGEIKCCFSLKIRRDDAKM